METTQGPLTSFLAKVRANTSFVFQLMQKQRKTKEVWSIMLCPDSSLNETQRGKSASTSHLLSLTALTNRAETAQTSSQKKTSEGGGVCRGVLVGWRARLAGQNREMHIHELSWLIMLAPASRWQITHMSALWACSWSEQRLMTTHTYR